jgi:hypothetical protein
LEIDDRGDAREEKNKTAARRARPRGVGCARRRSATITQKRGASLQPNQ